MARSVGRFLLCAGAGLSVVACNAALGGGLVVALGGAGYLASQCYDHVLLRVHEAATGAISCDAEVTLSDGDSERSMRPCYHAALTAGTWQVTARKPGYLPATATVSVVEPPDGCPYYTHTLELTLRRPEDASKVEPAVAEPAVVKPAAVEPAAVGPAAVEPAGPAKPSVPTRAFELTEPPAADAGA